MKKVVLCLVAVVMMCAAVAQAQPIKLSLWGDICVPNEDTTKGLEIAIGTETKEVMGLQWAFIYSKADVLKGVQCGIVTRTDDGLGAQLGFVNLAEKMTGLQWGFFNKTEDMKGAQLGFINWTKNMEGLQLGLVNIIENNKMFLPVFVFVNFCF